MKSLFLAIILTLLLCNNSFAPFIGKKLQEEANVFEVNCLLDASAKELTYCYITGYFTGPKLSSGYKGLVASFKIDKNSNKKSNHRPMLKITTYRNGKVQTPTPPGYFSAMEAAEKMLLKEIPEALLYFDALTGKRVPAPIFKSVSL